MTTNGNGSQALTRARWIALGGVVAGVAIVIGYFLHIGYGIYFDDIDLRPHLKRTFVSMRPGSNGDTEIVFRTVRFGPSGNPEAFPDEIKTKKEPKK